MSIEMGIAIGPALLLIWWFVRLDSKRPEPPGKVRNMMFFGALACIPAGIIELVASDILGEEMLAADGGLLNAFLIAACTEEMVKLAVVLLYVWNKPHFDEVMDGILYTAAASLGFALLENILYSAGDMATGLLRAFTAVPLHAICSGIMGYYVGRAKMASGGRWLWVLVGLVAAIAIHGLYDWAVFSGGVFGYGEPDNLLALGEILGLVVIFGLVLRRLVKSALRLDDEIHGAA